MAEVAFSRRPVQAELVSAVVEFDMAVNQFRPPTAPDKLKVFLETKPTSWKKTGSSIVRFG